MNREAEALRRVLNRAAMRWGWPGIQPIDWKLVLLDEGEAPTRELTAEQEALFFDHLRDDFHPLVLFALLTGQRLSNCYRLEWRQIDWAKRVIVFKMKSRGRDKEKKKTHALPVADQAVWALLDAQKGNHPERVFTYTAQRTRMHDIRPASSPRRPDQIAKAKPRDPSRCRGMRLPFTRNGWRRPFKDALITAGVCVEKNGDDVRSLFRSHDLRHSCAARLRDAGADITIAQAQLGHSDISVTRRYYKGSEERLREAQLAMAAQRVERLKAVSGCQLVANSPATLAVIEGGKSRKPPRSMS